MLPTQPSFRFGLQRRHSYGAFGARIEKTAELAAFVFYAVIVGSAVGFISEVYGDLQRAAGATERLLELLDAKALIQDPQRPKRLPGKTLRPLGILDQSFGVQ